MPVISHAELRRYFSMLLKPDRKFYGLVVVYTVAISLLTLAVPISVQTLISTVANTALLQPVVVLSVMLLILLLLSGMITALRTYVMELFRRRIYSRLTAEIVLRTLHSQNTFFEAQDRRSLFNRYFDIMTLQKTIPTLLVGGFSMVLQALVGFTVVSLYHPVFLIFNLGFLLIIYLIWRIWGPRAVDTGIEISHAKYHMAEWLERLADNNGFFRSKRHLDFAMDITEKNTAEYIDAHRRHFRKTFAQNISLLILYAVASAALLGLGGWLVILGELTLGQLVAAELIMAAIFFGVSQAGVYLDTFYDLCAGIEELSLFLRIPLEDNDAKQQLTAERHDVTCRNINQEIHHQEVNLNLNLPHGALISAAAERLVLQKWFTDLMKRHVTASNGQILIGDQDLMDIHALELRQAISVLDRPTIIECRVSEYLHMANPDASKRRQRELLQLLDMDDVIDSLEDGWNTLLHGNGSPLSRTETMRLRLAAALLAKPRILIITQVFDALKTATIERVIEYLKRNNGITFIAFTRHQHAAGWTHQLTLDFEQQQLTSMGVIDA